jgi:hypothetical protein
MMRATTIDPPAGEWNSKSIAKFRNKQRIAGFDRGLHRTGRHPVGFEKKKTDDESDDNRPTDGQSVVPYNFPGFTLCFPFTHLINLQNREERLLRNFDGPDLFHPFLTLFLFLKKFSLSRNIAAIALRSHILSKRRNRFACHDFRSHRASR